MYIYYRYRYRNRYRYIDIVIGRGRGIETNLASMTQDSMILILGTVKHDRIGRLRCARSEYSLKIPFTLQSLGLNRAFVDAYWAC
jgi:hypothetical protein